MVEIPFMVLPSLIFKHLREGAGLPGYLTWSCQGACGKIMCCTTTLNKARENQLVL